MTRYFGTYPAKIDSKNRVSLPAAFRNATQDRQAVCLVRVADRKCVIGGGAEDLLKRVSENYSDLLDSFYAMSHKITLDQEGRLHFSKVLREQLLLKASDVVFVGRGPIFEIYTKDNWDPAKDQAAMATLRNNLIL